MTAARLSEYQANGLRFACLEHGPSDGPLLLMVHGFPDTPHTWLPFLPTLAELGYRVVCPFQRGYAPTEIPADGRYDAEVLGRDVLGLMDACGAQTAVLVGHDWGAQSVYSAGALAPERVRLLVGVGIPHPATIRLSLRKLWKVRHFLTLRLPGAARRFARDDFHGVEVVCRRWSPSMPWKPEDFVDIKACFSQPGALDAAIGYYRATSPKLPAFLTETQRYPATIFGRQEPGMSGPEDFRRSIEAFEPGLCEVDLLPGGHFMHREHPDAFEAALVEVLQRRA